MASLAIFSNFRIDSEERLHRMKDSFLSFKDINATKWVINIRGTYKKDAMNFLCDQLDSRLVGYTLESPEGWFHDSRTMLKDIDQRFVLFWIEDHLNLISDMSLYDQIIEDMEASHVEYLIYSFFWVKDRYELISKSEMSSIYWLDLNEIALPLLQEKAPGAYIISCVGIFDISLFVRLISDDDERQAIKWPKETPFDFEKSSHDSHWLPIRMGFPKCELFASIDDDSVAPGSSLISRGLYSARQVRKAMGTPDQIRPVKQPGLPGKKKGIFHSISSRFLR
jgi:hypothetical protein